MNIIPITRTAIRLGFGFVLAFSALAASANQAGNASGPQGSALSPCRQPNFKQEVLCGSIRRPLDPGRPAGVQIDIHYVVVPALARNKLPDPVFLFAGGPGQSGIDLVGGAMPLFARLNNRRDIVFIDQRGTGLSAPLKCTDEENDVLDAPEDDDTMYARIEKCRLELQRLPYGDLRQFTTVIAMQDFDTVRAQLGVQQINAYGGSYGTRAVLEYMRQFPTHVRRAVIDSVAPPDMVLPLSFSTDGQHAFDAVFAACTADAACTAHYPQLHQEWETLLASLPRRISVADPMTGDARDVTLTHDFLVRAIRGPLYSPVTASLMPASIHAASQGHFEALAALTGFAGRPLGKHRMTIATGMFLSVACAESMPLLNTPAAITDNPQGADFSDVDTRFFRRVCASWPQGEVPDAFYHIAPSQTPVLITSGGDDPVTPPRHGEYVHKALGPKSIHVVVPHSGHGVLGNGCGADLMTRFLTEPDEHAALMLDTKCITNIPRAPVFLPLVSAAGGKHD